MKRKRRDRNKWQKKLQARNEMKKNIHGMNKKVLISEVKIILLQHFAGVIIANDKTKNENHEEEVEEEEHNLVATMNV
eukprot:15363286-Ditylum_brightwellii.AAC.1